MYQEKIVAMKFWTVVAFLMLSSISTDFASGLQSCEDDYDGVCNKYDGKRCNGIDIGQVDCLSEQFCCARKGLRCVKEYTGACLDDGKECNPPGIGQLDCPSGKYCCVQEQGSPCVQDIGRSCFPDGEWCTWPNPGDCPNGTHCCVPGPLEEPCPPNSEKRKCLINNGTCTIDDCDEQTERKIPNGCKRGYCNCCAPKCFRTETPICKRACGYCQSESCQYREIDDGCKDDDCHCCAPPCHITKLCKDREGNFGQCVNGRKKCPPGNRIIKGGCKGPLCTCCVQED